MNSLVWPESALGFKKERESKSSKPRELINRILINRQLLIFEVAAIKIQAIIRRRIALNRVKRIRHTFQIFEETCVSACVQFAEEAVLQEALELSIALLNTHAALRGMKAALVAAGMHILQSLLGEVLPALLLETIRETIREAADNFLRLRQEKKKKEEEEEEEVADAAGAVRARQQESERERNPFLRLLRELLDEAADGLVRAAVCAAVLEEVERVRVALLAEDLGWALLAEEMARIAAEECCPDENSDA